MDKQTELYLLDTIQALRSRYGSLHKQVEEIEDTVNYVYDKIDLLNYHLEVTHKD